MNSTPTIIVVPTQSTTTPAEDTKPIETQQPSYWDTVKMIIIFYVIIGIICYNFNKEWFDYLYMKPYNKIKEMFKTK